MSEGGLNEDSRSAMSRGALQPAKRTRRRWKRSTLRGYAEHHKIPLRRVFRMLREGRLPVRVGWVDKPTPIKVYARLQGIGRIQARDLYRAGVLCPMVMPHPRGGQERWPADSGIAELVLLYTHAERQLRVARWEADGYGRRLAALRQRATMRYAHARKQLNQIRRRLRFFEGALHSRDALLSRLKHEAELGRALAGGDAVVETIIRRAMGAEAWEALVAARDAGTRRELAARIRGTRRQEKAAHVTAASATGSDAVDGQRGLETPLDTASAAADVESSSNGVSHHGQ